MGLFRTKPLNPNLHERTALHRCLAAFDLTIFGIGAIIGAGIFATLSYAELSASIGGSGSAYHLDGDWNSGLFY